MHKIKLYTDEAMENKFDLDTTITEDISLYVHLNEKLLSQTSTTVSADGKNFTVKPINLENGNTVILALYNGKQFVEMQSAVCSGNDIQFTTDKAYTTAKVMVWNSLESMTPICETEIIK